jgi:hypothetical protein
MQAAFPSAPPAQVAEAGPDELIQAAATVAKRRVKCFIHISIVRALLSWQKGVLQKNFAL